MRQSTRGDVQWSGGTSGPRGVRFRNFVRPPSGLASALVRLLRKIMALRGPHQSIRLNRVSGCPTWSEGHCLRIRARRAHPSWTGRPKFSKGGCAAQGFRCACHVRTAERMRAVCRCTKAWLLLVYGFGIAKIHAGCSSRCAPLQLA